MRRVLITGASGGLGEALGRCFAADRLRIALHVHQNRTKGAALLRRLEAQGCEVLLLSADLRQAVDRQEMFRDLEATWGGLDVLLHCAGMRRDRLFHHMPVSDWDAVVDLNLSAAFYCMREAARLMMPQKKGHIINIASHGAFTGRVGQAAYTASKRGLIALSQESAREWGVSSIQVNAVCPGFLPTSMTEGLSEKHKDQGREENLLKRSSTLEEVAAFVRHLSNMRHVSGQTFHLDSRVV